MSTTLEPESPDGDTTTPPSPPADAHHQRPAYPAGPTGGPGARNTWRGLATMRTALILLSLLALAALLPQRTLSPKRSETSSPATPTWLRSWTGSGCSTCSPRRGSRRSEAPGTARTVGAQAWLRRDTRSIQLAGGVLLIAVGLALATGLWAGSRSCANRSPGSTLRSDVVA